MKYKIVKHKVRAIQDAAATLEDLDAAGWHLITVFYDGVGNMVSLHGNKAGPVNSFGPLE